MVTRTMVEVSASPSRQENLREQPSKRSLNRIKFFCHQDDGDGPIVLFVDVTLFASYHSIRISDQTARADRVVSWEDDVLRID